MARYDAVLGYVREHPGCSCRDVCNAHGFSYDVTYNILTALYGKRLVGRQHTALSRGAWYYFPETVAVSA